jgi:hypothetical protein
MAATLQGARTPDLDDPFERWVASEHGGWTDGGICSGCRREAPRLTRGIPWAPPLPAPERSGDRTCEWCLRSHFGSDEGEAHAVRALIGGAVRAGLDAEIPAQLFRGVVDETIIRDAEKGGTD